MRYNFPSKMRQLFAVTCVGAFLACSFKTRICHGPDCEATDCDGSDCGGVPNVYRSVGPNGSEPLATGTDNPLRIVGARATFTTPLPDRVGVGDVLLYSEQDGLVPNRIAFIAGRTSSTVFTVQGADGGEVADTQAPNAHWSLFRAYVSLADAVLGRKNPGLPSPLADVDVWPAGNDLVSANLIWNIACYADAPDVVELNPVVIQPDVWRTGPANYLRIYAPSLPTEVGVSQRHRGACDETKYELVNVNKGGRTGYHLIDIFADFVRIEGLQIIDRSPNSAYAHLNVAWNATGGDVRLEGNILRGNPTASEPVYGIVFLGQLQGKLKIWNNVMDGFSGPCVFDNTMAGTLVEVYLYSDTLYDCRIGLDVRNASVLAQNTIIDAVPTSGSCVSNGGSFSVLSDFNTCNLDEPMRGSHSQAKVSVGFVDPDVGNFHLAASDPVAGGKGVDLSSDEILPFRNDIDGAPRSGSWDIGADQR